MMQLYEVRLDGDHDCCGPTIELHSLVRLRAQRTGEPPVLSENRHGAERDWDTVVVSGRVVDIVALLGDETERAPITRLPSGRALRGFDPVDDGLLVSAVDDEPLTLPATSFVVTVLGTCEVDLPPNASSTASTDGWWLWSG